MIAPRSRLGKIVRAAAMGLALLGSTAPRVDAKPAVVDAKVQEFVKRAGKKQTKWREFLDDPLRMMRLRAHYADYKRREEKRGMLRRVRRHLGNPSGRQWVRIRKEMQRMAKRAERAA